MTCSHGLLESSLSWAVGQERRILMLMWSSGPLRLEGTALRDTPKSSRIEGPIQYPTGSRYQIIKDLGPKSHNNHGLEALIP